MERQKATEKTLHDQTNILPFAQLVVVFTGLAISLLITMVDQNGISVTLPTIARDLNAENTISWAGTSSLIANTMFTVLYGRLSDIFGRKIVYLAALCLLCVADLICGLSQNAPMFYVFRGLAGVAGGGVTSLTMIIVSDVVTLERRGKYQGILGSALGMGNVIGPFLGALFTMKATWRGFFWLISPLAACSAVVGYFLIPSNKQARKDGLQKNIRKIDFYGITASSIAIIFLLIPISGGGSYFSWDSPMVIAMLTVGGCALIAFVIIEWKVAALPMLPTFFFKNPVVAALFLQSFLLGAVYQSYLYYLPLYYQNAHDWSPIKSAALTAPLVVCQSLASITSGQYISRRKRYGEIIWLGFTLWTLGAGLTVIFKRDTPPGVIAGIMVVMGIGVGFTFQPTMVAMQAHVTKSQRAVIISDRNFFRCFGGACGLAISAAVLQATLRANLPAGFEYLAKSSYSLPTRTGISDADWNLILLAYAKASRGVFMVQAPLIGVCLVACLFIRDRGLERPKEPGEEENVPAPAAEVPQETTNEPTSTEKEMHATEPSASSFTEKEAVVLESSDSTTIEETDIDVVSPQRLSITISTAITTTTRGIERCIDTPSARNPVKARHGQSWGGAALYVERLQPPQARENGVYACDNDYPVCFNCRKAGVACDISAVRQENGQQNDYTRTLEERIAYLEGKLAQTDASSVANGSSSVLHPVAALLSPQSSQTPTQTRATTGVDSNPAGELVGFLALNSSEAPAYVGSSSGLSLVANLGEMVQATVWDQILSAARGRQQQQNLASKGQQQQQMTGSSSQTPGPGSNDRPANLEELATKTAGPPSDELGERILQAYMKRLHTRYPFLDRTEIWRLHHDRWRLAKIKREELSKEERFGLFKLYMTYAIGAATIHMNEKCTYVAPETFYFTALQSMPAKCETRSIENIEAMMLLVIFHLRFASSHGMWYMIGLAMRTAIDLGLHRKANEISLDPFTAQMRRRLFWTVYYLERVVSMSLGRPFSISDRHIDLELPLDVDDDIRDPAVLTQTPPPTPNPQKARPTTTLTVAIYLIRLRRIDSRIQYKIYRADRPLHSLRPKMDRLYLELEEWKASATSRFSGSALDHPMLHYNRAVRLLIQPFLPLLPITDPYYHICLRAAGDICQTHKRLHSTPEYGHSFMAVQTVFMAGITLLYALWTHTERIWSVQMSNDVRACSTVLFVMSERAAWVKKYRDAFELLVNAAMEKLQGDDTAKMVGIAELMTAQNGYTAFHTAAAANPTTTTTATATATATADTNAAMFIPSTNLPVPEFTISPPDSHEHGVRMALQLAPWIDQDENSPLWMPDFETLENLSGGVWSYGDTTTPFDF
ncbi:hypothetical protein ASPZODRAFT_11346 [Penicilliopsis zonata CBS 506.65]|uniref:Major facilitator superfamily (MFS) profile domain-containing protein n=1 Tax=Penicilliopsis zonata CBS 506.65 TaxID=1073090 RepID=A0A1L9STD0_9EURO|nr:hypothetical protein ASPZODRAFT_11346 [Penicilliopsis zonata CBS 506.65]OJJ50475.1 hypothetical protein ASPZODRAFT_11346 [Penicilliopsis zonata CBS 506.65]